MVLRRNYKVFLYDWYIQIIRRANEIGEDPKELSGRFCQEFLNDMTDLQRLIPTHQPRVTDHMDHIKDMITQVLSFLLFLYYKNGEI